MAADANSPSASSYIAHHLTHWQNKKQTDIVDFTVFNIDSLFFSILLGVVGCYLLYRAAKNVTSGVPGRFQAAVEMLYEMVDAQAKSIIHSANSRKMVAPLALVIFVWIILLNSMDLLPLDFLPEIWSWIYGKMGYDASHAYLRVVPTADLSVTMGMSLSVLLVCLFYNVKIKGAGGWAHELISAPFGDKFYLWPVNLLMQIIEFVAKTVSHGMRLFGNMYAGELIFMLIALMGGAFAFTATGMALAFGHVVAGTLWAIFHILIITLQAFVFMMLTLVYVGQAHDAH